jgi:hypothetical protein
MWESWNTRVWWLQLTVAFAWAGLVVFLWLGWTGATFEAAREIGSDGSLAVMVTTGCCGFTWVVGLVPIVLCFWILKE